MEVKDIVRKVKQIEIRARRRSEASLMGQYHSAFKGQGMTFSEVRPYMTGDEIRRMDWNKTARFLEPFVKVMEEERELTMMLLVDISASMNYGTKGELKKDFVAEIAVSLGFSAAGNNDKVGLILFADRVYKVIPPKKGKKHILAIISAILREDYVPTESKIEVALDYLMHIFKKKAFVFLFSDFEDPYDEKMVKIAAKKNQLLGLRIFDEKDEQIPDVGYAEFNDAETAQKIWVNTSNSRFRYEFAERQKQKIKKTKEIFEKSSAHFLSIAAADDYAKILYQYFQRK